MEEKIKAIIEEMDDGDKIALWNESCRECNYYDDEIYSMGEFDEIMDGYSPLDIVRKIYYGGNFNPNSRETWPDTQARALLQAARRAWNAVRAAEC